MIDFDSAMASANSPFLISFCAITNAGTKVTEFYVYGSGQRVLAEAENISPGLQRRLEVRFDEPGTYQTACKPGMAGDGIRGDFVVNR